MPRKVLDHQWNNKTSKKTKCYQSTAKWAEAVNTHQRSYKALQCRKLTHKNVKFIRGRQTAAELNRKRMSFRNQITLLNRTTCLGDQAQL